jgi:hypothetical protein
LRGTSGSQAEKRHGEGERRMIECEQCGKICKKIAVEGKDNQGHLFCSEECLRKWAILHPEQTNVNVMNAELKKVMNTSKDYAKDLKE